MTAREMQVEFERVVILMNPDFELKEKLTSDTIFAFLNSAQERFIRNNYLQEDAVQDGTRAQKKNADSLKGLITRTTLILNSAVIATPVITEVAYSTGNLDSTVINKDINDVVASKVTTEYGNMYLVGVDQKQKKTITTYTYSSDIDVFNTDNTSARVKLPINYFLYIRSNSLISKNYKIDTEIAVESDFVITPNKTIREDDVEKIISTFYNKAILRNPYVVLNSGNEADSVNNTYINVIHDEYTTIKKLDLVYYRKPLKFDVIDADNIIILDTCELPENVHREIVELAVEMFITEAKYRLNMKQPASNNNQ